jgi:molybdopterin biosynthesis enzyme
MPVKSEVTVIERRLAEAKHHLLSRARRVKGSDKIALDAAIGRVLMEDVAATAGQTAIPAGHLLERADAVRLAAIGRTDVSVRRYLAIGLVTTAVAAPMAARLTASLTSTGCTVEQIGILDNAAPLSATRRLLRKAGALHDVVLSFGIDLNSDSGELPGSMREEGDLAAWHISDINGAYLGVGTLGPADHLALPADEVLVENVFRSLVLPFLRACQGCLPSP